MTLIYRGQSYPFSHKVASVNSQQTFTYRGQSYQRSASVKVLPKINLVYRGVPYFPNCSNQSIAMGMYLPAYH